VVKKDGEACRVGDVIGYIEEGESAGEPGQGARRGPGGPPHIIMPAAGRVLGEQNLSPDDVTATGPGGRLLKEDVLRHVEAAASGPASGSVGEREEEVVPMSLLRRRIAGRLVEAQQTAALLTTFNEIDMSGVVSLRRDFGAAFQEKYGVKLGLMSFFVKAAVDALKLVPAVNAEIRGTDIVYRNYYDIGVAVGGGKGLVVPVLRHAERLSFAEIERAIADFAARARDNKLKVEELQGGTFTISNGGIYGSMLSTPIVNPPQSGILGLHAMQDRPVAREGQVVVRPMMYVALTYDHRLIDGREAVTFLKHIKEVIETPARMLIEV
jgi:2-oxoglutarate dehydrogenase E2 component (dihydrolipoamide succinyltransferase)